MRYLAMTVAALFLASAPVTSFAQATNGDSQTGTKTGGDAAGGSGNGSGNGAGGNDNNATDSTASTTRSGSDRQCSEDSSVTNYDQFTEGCRKQIDEWTMGQTGASVAFQGDLAVGTVVPETVEVIEVPAYRSYGYVMLNDRRVLVDRTTHKIVRIY